MSLTRRTFLRLSSLASASLPFLSWKYGLQKPLLPVGAQVSDEALFTQFANPESKYRPFVRWWWNGDRVTKTEVLRELDLMKAAGIGGVEINPIKWNQNADAINIPELSWGSPEWLDVVEAAVRGAKEKGMTCDMIIGSGWPFGGEFVPREEQSQIVMLGTKNLEGGKSYQLNIAELLAAVTPPSNYKKKVTELFMLRLVPGELNDFNPGVRLDDQIKKDEISITVPPGNHVLYYLVKITGFQTVIQGALGANGPVINHYDKAAVQHYLDGFAEKLTSKLGRLDQYFRALFTDSIELEGANWCNDMFAQFKQRRGYDIEPYFPFILFKVGEMGNAVNEVYGTTFSPDLKALLNRVHYDFEQTRIELFHERFIETFTAWCKKHGVKSRMQAYGMDCHPLEASMMLDIPECETWIWTPEIEEFDDKGGGRNYTMVNKFVCSAAHLSDKQLISCEELTNTGDIFSSTLERIKVTGDQSNLSGVTHSILHGFNYSPIETPFPGWIRYGSYLNERNTWWPYFRKWSDYKTRISCLLQHGVMQADIAVMHPLVDLASKFGFQRDPFPRVSYPSYVHQVWEAIHQNGNGCDYVSEHIITKSAMQGGAMNFGSRKYRTLIMIEVESLAPETMVAIHKFADAGGKVIFVGKAPHLSPGLTAFEEKGKQITAISDAMISSHHPNIAIVPAPGKNLLSWYRKIQEEHSITPFISISDPVYHINQLYYQAGGKDVFFFTNYSAKHAHSFKVKFPGNKTAWVWNAETGERLRYPPMADGSLELDFGPSESKLIVYDDQTDGALFQPFNMPALRPLALTAPWQLELTHVDGTKTKLQQDSLSDLKKNDAYQNFSGTILYRSAVDVTTKGSTVLLDLGHVNDVSELEVNGKAAGVKWYGRHLYDISQLVKQGKNDISIKIVTTLGAYTKSLINNKAAMEWSGGKLIGPTGLDSPVQLLLS